METYKIFVNRVKNVGSYDHLHKHCEFELIENDPETYTVKVKCVKNSYFSIGPGKPIRIRKDTLKGMEYTFRYALLLPTDRYAYWQAKHAERPHLNKYDLASQIADMPEVPTADNIEYLNLANDGKSTPRD